MNHLPARHAPLSTRHQVAALLLILCLSLSAAQAQSLSFEEVVKLVTERDIEIAQSADRESMLRDSARVSAALPPPNLMLSASNFPVDTFATNQEPMTQLVAKVSQMFPPGDSRRWRSTSEERLAEAAVIQRELRSAMLRQQLRTVWADAWKAQASVNILESNRIESNRTVPCRVRADSGDHACQLQRRYTTGASTRSSRGPGCINLTGGTYRAVLNDARQHSRNLWRVADDLRT